MKTKKMVSMMVVAAMVGTMFTGCGTSDKAAKVPAGNAVAVTANNTDTVDSAKKAVTHTLNINVTADKGWDKDSTPAIAHIKSDDKKVDFYHAVSPDKDGKKGSSKVELSEGKYTVEFVSPLNKDGSAYEIYDTGKAQEIEVTADNDKEVKIDCPMTQIPAEKVTDEMVKDIVDKTQEAVEKGDETLKGDKGKDVLGNLVENVGNNPNASEETKKDAETVKEETKTDSKPAETVKNEDKGASDNGNKNNAASGNNASSNNTASNNNASSGNNNGSGNNAPAEQPKPSHQHAWKEHTATTQTWVPNIVTVEDYGTQQVAVGTVTYCNCGAVLTSGAYEHAVAHLRAGEDDGCQFETLYETQTVVVGSHTEDHGHYETSTYVDYYYCDCGATK